MSTTEQRLSANRANAQLSTGPATPDGKVAASLNATRHGLLSNRLFLDDEDPGEFQTLLDELAASLRPTGAIEVALVERIAVTIWRQRRLVRAETATITLARQPRVVAQNVSKELGREYEHAVKPQEFEPFNQDRIAFCHKTLAEIEALEEIDLKSLAVRAPTVHRQLLDDAEDETPEGFLAERDGGLTSYVAELMLWCRKELREAEARPHLIAIAELIRSKGIFLAPDTIELLSRYQTTLDNQLYKALKALREAQEWRLRTLEPTVADSGLVDRFSAQDAA